MNFAYAGAKRIARFDVNPLNQQKMESRFYLLGGKEVRLDAHGQIRAQLLPIYGGAARRTISGTSSSDEFMVKNRLGSTVRSWSVQSGAVRINMAADYDAWGRQMHLKESPNSEELAQRFTGKERDRVSGLDYFGARYYDSDVGYWLSPDAARQKVNLFAYSADPLNNIDPNGLWEINYDKDWKNFTVTNFNEKSTYDIYQFNDLNKVYPQETSDGGVQISGGNLVAEGLEWYDAYSYGGMRQTENAVFDFNKSLGVAGLFFQPLGLMSSIIDGFDVGAKLFRNEKLDWHDGLTLVSPILIGQTKLIEQSAGDAAKPFISVFTGLDAVDKITNLSEE